MSARRTVHQTYWNARTRDFTQPHARLQLIRRLIDGLPRGVRTILDVGCGGAALKDLLPGTLEYFGVDIANSVINAQRDPEHFQVVDLECVHQFFGGRTFDLVVCSGICEYISNWNRFMRLLRRSCPVGGFLILTFTNHEHYSESILRKRLPDPHVNFMSIPQMRASLQKHGFSLLRYTSISVRGTTLPVVGRFLGWPLNLFNRQYLFVCEYRPLTGSRVGWDREPAA
jgi:SAM-dependent methyltransferase